MSNTKYLFVFFVAVSLGALFSFLYLDIDISGSSSVNMPVQQQLPDGLDTPLLETNELRVSAKKVGYTQRTAEINYYGTAQSHLTPLLSHHEDQSPKLRKGGYRYQKADMHQAQMYLDKKEQQTVNKSLISSIVAGGQATNIDNTGFLFIPADAHGAVGPDHVVNVINTSIEFYDKDGGNGVSTSLQSFFAPLNPLNFTFDPKVVYDQYHDRWVVVTIQRTDTIEGDPDDTSNVFIAVSDDDNPNGNWYMLDINTLTFIDGAERWFDYPGLAVDEEVIYLTGNMFGFGNNGTGVGSRLWIVEKEQFYNGQIANVIGPINPYTQDGINTATMPAHVYGTAANGFGTFLASYSGLTDGVDEYWQFVRLDNPLGVISLTQGFINIGNTEDFGGPLPLAPQQGSNEGIQTNDRRALNAVWRDGKLYSAATIDSINDVDQTSASFVVLDAPEIGFVTLNQFGVIDGEDIAADASAFFPAITVNSEGGIGIGFSASANTIFPGSYFTFQSPTDPLGSHRSSQVATAGTDFYVRTFGGTNRWGDYSAIALDPITECFWTYNKHATTRGTVINNEDGMYATSFGEFCNQQPIAADDTTEVIKGGTVDELDGGISTVLDNDSDPDIGDSLEAVIVSGPNHANAFVLNSDGTFSYTHDDGNDPSDSFTYQACDDGTPVSCQQATVTITINTPINTPPTAADDNVNTNEDTMIGVNVLNGDSDVDGDDLSVTLCGTATNGSVVQNGNACEYTPDQDFNGADSFNYSISDGNGGSDSATVNMTVDSVNDQPVAANNNVNTNEDSMISVNVLDGDSDVDGDDLSVTSCGAATNGSVVQNGNACDYTPDQDFNGADSFNYYISDGNGGSDSATVNMTVDSVNDQPSMTVNTDTYVSLSQINNNPTELVACQMIMGPANESGQVVADMVVNIDSDVNGILNNVDVDNDGHISYGFTGQTGVAQITVALQDDGGIDNGGVDTSPSYLINVHVQDYIFRNDFESKVCQ